MDLITKIYSPTHLHVLQPLLSSTQPLDEQSLGQFILGHDAPHGHGVVIHRIGQSLGSFRGGAAKHPTNR